MFDYPYIPLCNTFCISSTTNRYKEAGYAKPTNVTAYDLTTGEAKALMPGGTKLEANYPIVDQMWSEGVQGRYSYKSPTNKEWQGGVVLMPPTFQPAKCPDDMAVNVAGNKKTMLTPEPEKEPVCFLIKASLVRWPTRGYCTCTVFS